MTSPRTGNSRIPASSRGLAPARMRGRANAPQAPIPPREVWRLGVAVRTKQRKVLEAVVEAVPIDVVQRDRQGAAAPLGNAAALTSGTLEALCDQPPLELTARCRSVPREKLPCGRRSGAGSDVTTPDCIGPCRHAETEAAHALADGAAVIVEGGDGLPVVSGGEPRVSLVAETPCVIADGALGDAEGPRNVGDREPSFEHPAHVLSCHADELAAEIGRRTRTCVRPHPVSSFARRRLRGRDLNPDFTVQSRANCRLFDPAGRWLRIAAKPTMDPVPVRRSGPPGETRAKVMELLAQGLRVGQIARRLGVTPTAAAPSVGWGQGEPL